MHRKALINRSAWPCRLYWPENSAAPTSDLWFVQVSCISLELRLTLCTVFYVEVTMDDIPMYYTLLLIYCYGKSGFGGRLMWARRSQWREWSTAEVHGRGQPSWLVLQRGLPSSVSAQTTCQQQVVAVWKTQSPLISRTSGRTVASTSTVICSHVCFLPEKILLSLFSVCHPLPTHFCMSVRPMPYKCVHAGHIWIEHS